MHNESLSDRLAGAVSETPARDDGPPRPESVVMVTFVIHKADTDDTRNTDYTFVTTVAVHDKDFNATERNALNAALANGTVTEAGDYLVSLRPEPDADRYRARAFHGQILTVTTTPRIAD